MPGSLQTSFGLMKHLPGGMHTVHARCILKNMQICKYEIYKEDRMKEDKTKIRKEENQKIRKREIASELM
jgi:hypothetical protein